MDRIITYWKQETVNCSKIRHKTPHYNMDLDQSELPRLNSVESALRCTLRIYFDNVMPTSQKPCRHNNKFDCSETNCYNIPQDAINEV